MLQSSVLKPMHVSTGESKAEPYKPSSSFLNNKGKLFPMGPRYEIFPEEVFFE